MAPEPQRLSRADDLEPRWNWQRALPAPGRMGVDFETRVDFRRLQRYRLARAKAALENSECGAGATIRPGSGASIAAWTVGALAKEAGIAQSYVSEHGRKRGSVRAVAALAKALRVDIEDLLAPEG